VPELLVAWLYDTPVAVLRSGPDFRIELEWRAEGIERWGLGSRVLSVGLAIGSPIGPRDLRGLDFFENMLPEGPALARMATLAGLPGGYLRNPEGVRTRLRWRDRSARRGRTAQRGRGESLHTYGAR
jgi:hypothetical protein